LHTGVRRPWPNQADSQVFLGTDGESPAEASTPETSPPLDPVAAAVAVEAARSEPELAQKASAYFEKQTRLVEIQTEHLHEQRAVNLALLKYKRSSERLNFGLRIFFVLVATITCIGGLVLIHDAVTSRSVVIEPFETSPALAESGLTGTVVASAVLDELTRLQAATRNIIQSLDLANSWSGEIKLTVPETGISIGEISQLLKARFGHDIHIRGDMVQTKSGSIEVTIRGDRILAKTFTGTSDQLNTLTIAAAEYVYAQSQPALWAIYLIDTGRYTEAIEFCRASTASAAKSDQPVLLTHWAVAIADSVGPGPEVLALLQKAIALNPEYWDAYLDLMNVKLIGGKEEEVWRLGEEVRRVAGGRPGRARELTYLDSDFVIWDIPLQLRSLREDAASSSGNGTFSFATGPEIAQLEAWQHDPEAAELSLQTTKPDSSDPTIDAGFHWVHGLLAAESGESARAASEMEAFLAAYSDPAVAWAWPGSNCWVAPVEEVAGHPDKADAVLKTGGTFVDCYRFCGDILDHRGDWVGAQRAYEDAVALAPDLPAGYYSWGLALARHGDLAAAILKLTEANRRGPHWADPLKAWGDVLARQGKTRDAFAKYKEALKYAPNWKQLTEAIEPALRKVKT
jgi:tetratricopeptide (TPR) repeat protein